ncbi:MAG TPA: class I tRNA ligase family protein, partial [Acidobacteriaceae bacterium]|nr:class I tRNA ligase family protein [Acidobacteriaceae bacterium]
DAVPFRQVYIHALVRDADRQKMSKTKGNVIDPIEIVKRFGTDAVRFTLAAMASPGTDIAFSEERTDGYRAFANKIWNAARFIFMQLDRAAEAGMVVDPQDLPEEPFAPEGAPLDSRWIVARLNSTVIAVDQALQTYRFHEAANLVYQFFWGDFCDWYLEIVKLRLDFSESADRAATNAALTTLLSVFEAALRLLSPFMPFITEEIWHALYNGAPPVRSIALSRFPRGGEHSNDAAEAEMSVLQELIVTLRALRKDLGVEEKATVPARLSRYRTPADCIAFIQRLARVSEIVEVEGPLDGANGRSTANFDVAIVYERKIDIAAERERLAKELARFEKEMANASRQLENEGFLSKAPPNVVEGLRRRAEELSALVPKTQAALDSLNVER